MLETPVIDVTVLDFQPKYDPQVVAIIKKKHFKRTCCKCGVVQDRI